MSSESAPLVKEVQVDDLPLVRVVVFNDRAEVRRLAKLDIEAGITEVHVKNFKRSLVHDSIRVDGRGKATIHEVVVQEKAARREEVDTAKVAQLREVLDVAEKKKMVLDDKESILRKRLEVLDSIVSSVGTGIGNPPKEGGPLRIDDSSLEGLTKFFGFYDDNSARLRADLRKVSEDVADAKQEVDKAHHDLAVEEQSGRENFFTKVAVVTLEAKESTPVELEITYQAHCVGWTPSYDIRVDTGAKPTLKITYFGKINQNTYEDWIDAPLVLSTAQPCISGHIPELGTLEAIFHRPPPVQAMPTGARFGARPRMAKIARGSAGDNSVAGAALFGGVQMESMQVAMPTEVREAGLSTEFKIVRNATIPNGVTGHKVTIGIVEVVPLLVHESVPSKNAAAFLTASALNSSNLALLAGQASVFLNNAFVAKTHLKNVSPGERFSCSLGVDTAVKIEYKPAKKYHEQLGLINKSSSTATEQVITVKNTRVDQPILLTIKQHVPRTTDEKIKIRLVNPTATPYDENADYRNSGEVPDEPKEGAKMNSAHNLEWTVRLDGGQSKDLHVKWAVEHPKEEKVEFVEKF